MVRDGCHIRKIWAGWIGNAGWTRLTCVSATPTGELTASVAVTGARSETGRSPGNGENGGTGREMAAGKGGGIPRRCDASEHAGADELAGESLPCGTDAGDRGGRTGLPAPDGGVEGLSVDIGTGAIGTGADASTQAGTAQSATNKETGKMTDTNQNGTATTAPEADKVAPETVKAPTAETPEARTARLEAHAEVVKVAREALEANDRQRTVPDVSKEQRAQFPQLRAAHVALVKAIADSPAWKLPDWTEGDKLAKVPPVSTLVKGTKEAPATVERREFTLIRLGMPTTARVELVAAMIRLSEAWNAAGLNLTKQNAEAITFD